MSTACLFLFLGHKLPQGKYVLLDTLLKYTRSILGDWLNPRVHAFVGLSGFLTFSHEYQATPFIERVAATTAT